jgi:Tol biopolymer transport system component
LQPVFGEKKTKFQETVDPVKLGYNGHDHSSYGLVDGNDVLFAAQYSGGDGSIGINQYNLDGSHKKLISGYPPSGTHVSSISRDAKGVFVGSSVGKSDKGRLDQEIFMYDANINELKRLCHHNSYAKPRGSKSGYWGEPHPSMSPTGSRIVFSSDWYGSNAVNTYILDL